MPSIFVSRIPALLGLLALPLAAHSQNQSQVTHAAASQITGAERTSAIKGALERLQDFYVFPDTATRMAGVIHARQKRGEFRAISDGNELAERLTRDFQEIAQDKHLRVQFFADGAPPSPVDLAPGPAEIQWQREQGKEDNFGFKTFRHLPGNVAYLDVRAFYNLAVAAPTITAAMSLVAGSDALILDLRHNFGGEPDSVTFVASYLFDAPTLLDNMRLRWPQYHTLSLRTAATVPGVRFGPDKPVYILTSHQTFSGGEAFVYDLQALQRAQVVGEITAGGAHMTIPIKVTEHFRVLIPFGRSVNPVTGKDWEGTGITPDKVTSANDAPASAYKMALEKLGRAQSVRPPPAWSDDP
jgi:hypothetical protein